MVYLQPSLSLHTTLITILVYLQPFLSLHTTLITIFVYLQPVESCLFIQTKCIFVDVSVFRVKLGKNIHYFEFPKKCGKVDRVCRVKWSAKLLNLQICRQLDRVRICKVTALSDFAPICKKIAWLHSQFALNKFQLFILCTVKPLITNTSEEFIKCRLDYFSMSFTLY